jgi:hypothetical protein
MLLACNWVIHATAKTSQRRHMLSRIEQIPVSTECVFLGNSLVEAGCDTDSFQQAWANAIPGHRITSENLALGATTPVEHCLILHHLLRRPIHLKLLVYGFFDDQLNSSPQGEWSQLVGNRALSYYFPKEAAGFYAPGSSVKTLELTVTGHIPMLAERSSLWGKVEMLRRSMEQIGMPRREVNRFGRVEDFTSLEPKDVSSFTERCEAVVHAHRGFSAPVQQIIELARQQGTQVILVEMPLPSRHRQAFYSTSAWNRLRTHLQSLANSNKVLYMSASDWVQDDSKFEDATHLNEEGAKIFSALLGGALSRQISATTPGSLAAHGL